MLPRSRSKKEIKKVEDKVTFITNNINFLIAAVTGLVAVSSLYKMLIA